MHYDEIGTIDENELFFDENTKVSIDELITSNKNWLIKYMRN